MIFANILMLFKANKTAALGMMVCAGVACFAAGFCLAFWAQGVRITRAEQALIAYQQHIKAEEIAAADAADIARAKTEKSFKESINELNKQVAAGAAFKRCVDAGKCGKPVIKTAACVSSAGLGDTALGLRQPAIAGSAHLGFSPTGGAFGTSASTISTSPGTAADGGQTGQPATTDSGASEFAVIGDCAVSVLQLNALQSAVENQPGY